NRGTNSVRKNLTKPNFHKTENQTKTLTNPTPQKSKARQKQKKRVNKKTKTLSRSKPTNPLARYPAGDDPLLSAVCPSRFIPVSPSGLIATTST
ncbi:hypothetical protein, partial [Mobiluncus porci]|uniref:hypothetical protein n=1 Tax=Mobiluncus porci TaxID=2652278 RepID=UPI001E53348A